MKKPILVYSALALVAAAGIVAGLAYNKGYLGKIRAEPVAVASAPATPEKPKDEKPVVAEAPAAVAKPAVPPHRSIIKAGRIFT